MKPNYLETPPPIFSIESLLALCAPFFDSTPKKEDEDEYDINLLFY